MTTSAPAPKEGSPDHKGSSTIAWADLARRQAFEAWLRPLSASLGLQSETVRLASADAASDVICVLIAEVAAAASSWMRRPTKKTAARLCTWPP